MIMSIWRLQTNTSKGDISKYCIKNSIAAVGWSLSEKNIPPSALNGITFEDYCNYAEDLYNHYDSVSRLYYLNENDLIWMKSEGIYYIARVSSKSKWHFCVDDEAINLDACNQMSDIKWLECGDESSVPGAITTAFIRGSTFQRIWKAGVKEFSELIFNEQSKTNQYDTKIELNQDTFYSLISPSDCEDLLCMWLFNTYGYVCIPSTNKIATQKYECVLLDPASGKHIYIQVKNGEINLNSKDYYNIFSNSEFWLLSTKGTVQIDDSHKNVRRADPTALFEFACEDKNENIIPPSIKYWIAFDKATE